MGIGRPSSVANVRTAPRLAPSLRSVSCVGFALPTSMRLISDCPTPVALARSPWVRCFWFRSAAGQLRDQLLVTGLSGLGGIMGTVNTSELALPDDYPRLLAELKAQI